MVRQNVTGLQWMASEAWTATTVLQIPSYMPFLAGTLGIAIRRGEIPGLRDFLLRIRPDNDTLSSKDNNIVNIFILLKKEKCCYNVIYYVIFFGVLFYIVNKKILNQ